MASGLCHAIIDLLAFGYPHFDLHQWKDEPARELGRAHRSERHEWYQAFGVEWDLDDPFPASVMRAVEHAGERGGDEDAERYMSWASHDCIDRVWDGLSAAERLYFEGVFVWILERPDVLVGKFGVDVVGERVARNVEGGQIWEPAPGLGREYRRLRAYADAVLRERPKLKAVLLRYGGCTAPPAASP